VCPAATKVLETTQAACTLAFGTVTARRVLFVIDISGSMDCTCEFRGRSSTRLDLVKEDLRAVLKTIGDESYFGILAFDNNTKWVSRFGRATKDNVRQALSAVNSLEANGGTDIYSALSEAVGVHRREGLDAIYLLTDGEDGREDETVELVRGSSMPKVHTTAMRGRVQLLLAGQPHVDQVSDGEGGGHHRRRVPQPRVSNVKGQLSIQNVNLFLGV
jgi:uncharacterized protein with von Willebrand factor type A (vWA) domain